MQTNVPQMPIEAQVAIALYHFGHYGNAISTQLVALWAGVGYGTVHLIMQHVMKAICSDCFRHSALYWPMSHQQNTFFPTTKKWLATAWSLLYRAVQSPQRQSDLLMQMRKRRQRYGWRRTPVLLGRMVG
ncbi:uncharacterized protein EDB91DRAFT_1042132 [Suillus paluster]|uniref:uncharacterized protein n=1 Tax=Suillus paluster TaxID=48578 RepID=UPI001B864BC7|nr:uncharacterized protein EDB91DRAFT_1042132 [Suillus paluster]KAG1754720.1 hypothetical protein EDB91DRAFT_1042132 [Suillus paluster]